MSSNIRHAKGHIAKLQVQQKYIAKGFYIFEEANQGPIDFIAVHKDGTIKLVEVKAVSKRKNNSKISRPLDASQVALNKKLAKKHGKDFKIAVEYADVNSYFNQA